MRTAQRSPLAIAMLEHLGHVAPDVVGDLEEAHRSGRSRAWLWRQMIALIGLRAYRQLIDAPLHVVGALVIGWGVLGVTILLGDRLGVAGGLASAVWGWDVTAGYGRNWWWPFQLSATVVSYSGFALSAWMVGRYQRGGPLVVLHVASVLVGLVVAATVIEVLSAQGTVPVPHPLFYFLHVTLPYQWRSGVLIVPVLMLSVGTFAAGKWRPTPT